MPYCPYHRAAGMLSTRRPQTGCPKTIPWFRLGETMTSKCAMHRNFPVLLRKVLTEPLLRRGSSTYRSKKPPLSLGSAHPHCRVLHGSP